ncbi:MAG: response regulator transcription factor [Chloroflexi bacterium]|nr:MAG: response regulator transcription factor [Chloroflexota bacterium]
MRPSVLSSSVHLKRGNIQDYSSPHCILIVDKHVGIAKMLNWAFTLEGYDSVAIEDQSWISQALAQKHHFSAILLDLSRNLWLNRDACIDYIEEQWSTFYYGNPPLIVLTTTSTPDRHVNGYPLFHKPFYVGDLIAKVKSLVSYIPPEFPALHQHPAEEKL